MHRFEEVINGREYLIEVSSVGLGRWRAQIARVPGGCAARDVRRTSPLSAAQTTIVHDWVEESTPATRLMGISPAGNV